MIKKKSKTKATSDKYDKCKNSMQDQNNCKVTNKYNYYMNQEIHKCQ